MPSIYAHNKYGKLVIPKLPKEIKSVIKKYPDSFRIGLQGPDFLFFYKAFFINKINQKGGEYHKKDAYIFMENALHVIKKYGTDSPQYSYILGVICHFSLDAACHPYVNKFMEITGCGHVEIEGDLDQLILTSEGYIPECYPMHLLVPVSREVADSMAPFYDDISKNTVYSCLKWMRLIKKFFVAPGFFKRSMIDFALHLTFHYKKLNGHIVMPKANKKCRQQTKFLYKTLRNVVPDAVFLINNFHSTVMGHEKLSGKFHKDFNGARYE